MTFRGFRTIISVGREDNHVGSQQKASYICVIRKVKKWKPGPCSYVPGQMVPRRTEHFVAWNNPVL